MRKIQLQRFEKTKIHGNAQMGAKLNDSAR
jgi:hypothetical protein